MSKRRDPVALREVVRDPGFTPGAGDLDGLVVLLGDEDKDVVRQTERAVVRAGRELLPRLLQRLVDAPPRARAHGFRAVGSLAPKDAASAQALIAGLSDPDARVQRGAATALGRLQGSEAASEIAEALTRAWDEAPELPLARALAEAMGKLAIEGARSRLEAVQGGDAELSRIARRAETMLARDASRGEESEIDGERASTFPVDLVFHCRPGLEQMLVGEVRDRCPEATSVRMGDAASGQVFARWQGAPAKLLSLRTMLDFAFALPTVDLGRGQAGSGRPDGRIEDACVRVLSSDEARRILTTWTRGTIRYRLDWRGEGHGRGTTWRIVHALAEHVPEWVNDPTDSTWQVSLAPSRDGERLRVMLSPRKLHDPRFTYRLADVPAASHPTLAAALVRASGVTGDDVVWDPFVGSATELIERARAGPYRALIGSDVDPAALAAARINLDAATLEGVTLSSEDATSFAPRSVTRIITNPPMGRRVARDGSLADLLDRFTDHAASVLAPRGRLAWFSPMPGRTAARAEAGGFRVSLRQEVDMGGFSAELQVWERGGQG